MSDLFGTDKPSDSSERKEALKAKLTFGEVASALGLSGSTPHGWDCPACGAEQSIREGSHHRGGRCQDCETGFDIIGLIQEMEDTSFTKALDRLEGILEDLSQPQSERLV